MGTWYHGSPFELDLLMEGSTITQERDLTRIFSHKPALVALNDQDGKVESIQHNGLLPGFLYSIDERLARRMSGRTRAAACRPVWNG